MSDYLRRAVEREMSEASTVRPALPSLFESGKTSALAAAMEPESSVEGELSRKTPPEANAGDTSLLPAPLGAVTELSAEVAEVKPGRATTQIVGTPVPASMAAASPPESPSPALQNRPPDVVVRRMTEAPVEPPPVPTLEMEVPTPQIARATTKGTKAKSELLPAVEPVAAPAASAVPPLVPVITPATSPGPPIVPAPTRSERAANSRAPRPDPAAPRAIHITIGRIEVHAVHPPPAPLPPRRAPASPKISLEDYLKQRNGGTR